MVGGKIGFNLNLLFLKASRVFILLFKKKKSFEKRTAVYVFVYVPNNLLI